MQSMRQLLRNLLMIFVLAGFFADPAVTQTANEPTSEIKIDKNKLLVQPRNADGSLVMVSFPLKRASRTTRSVFGKALDFGMR